MKLTEKAEIRQRLRCPKCDGELIIYNWGLACRKIHCGGIFGPEDIHCKLTLKSLKKEFPELRSMSSCDLMIRRQCERVTKKPPGPSVRKKLKSMPGQLPLL